MRMITQFISNIYNGYMRKYGNEFISDTCKNEAEE